MMQLSLSVPPAAFHGFPGQSSRRQRAELMFVVGARAPVVSGRDKMLPYGEKITKEDLRRAGKRPPPKPSAAMEFDDKGAETQESAAAWKKRMCDWNLRMRLYYELNREAPLGA
jgi:hypothetical protein